MDLLRCSIQQPLSAETARAESCIRANAAASLPQASSCMTGSSGAEIDEQ